MIFKLSANDFLVDDSEKIMNFAVLAGFVGIPTDKTPSVGGVSGWSFMLSDENAEEAVKGLVGMGVNCCWHSNKEFAKHDKNFKIGVINEAHLDGNKIMCSGYLWKCDFPEICDTIKNNKDLLGASVELSAKNVNDDSKNKVRIASGIEFTGLSIVYREKASFSNTQLMCSVMEEEELAEKNEKTVSDFKEMLDKSIAELTAKNEEILNNTVKGAVEEITNSVKMLLSAKDEAKEEEKDEQTTLSAEIIKAINDGFNSLKGELSAKAEVEAPARKTVADLSAFDRYGKDKNMMELSAEIDNDASLSAEQKWATKLNLWQKANNA